MRRRRDEWGSLGLIAALKVQVRAAYQKMVGYDLNDISIDGCITKAPSGGDVAGRSPVDRGKQGTKRSQAVDGDGVPLATPLAPANVVDHQLLAPTLAALEPFLAQPSATTIHLDAGYDYVPCYAALAHVGVHADVTARGVKMLINKSPRWKVERTNSWMNNFGLLRRMTERRRAVAELFVDLAEIIVTVRALVRTCWLTHRWSGRPRTRCIR